MIRALLLAAALGTPAAACEWGNGVNSTTVARPTPEGGEVILHNRLSCCHKTRTTCFMGIDGVGDIGVVWQHKPGDEPDEVMVMPPLGWRAVPPVAIVPEEDEITVRIIPDLLG